jgi:hypothetical protein
MQVTPFVNRRLRRFFGVFFLLFVSRVTENGHCHHEILLHGEISKFSMRRKIFFQVTFVPFSAEERNKTG